MTDDFKERIRAIASANDPVETAKTVLEDWQVGMIDTHPTREDQTEILFNTPLPGNQPIASTIVVEDGEVVEATIRYGVLSKQAFDTHPSQSDKSLRRLKQAINRVPYPFDLERRADFGDANRKPRPHLRVGNRVSPADDDVGLSGGGDKPPAVGAFLEYVIDTSDEMRNEFANEYVKPVPGLEDAPRFIRAFIDLVSGKWDVEEARPSSITNTEVELTETLRDATVEFNEEGEVVRFSATFGTSPLAREVQSDAEWRELVEDQDFPPETTAFVREQSGKREVNWDSARAGDTAGRERVASALRGLALFA